MARVLNCFFAERKNKVDKSWYNGIFERYKNPVRTNEHILIEWHYDLNEDTTTISWSA